MNRVRYFFGQRFYNAIVKCLKTSMNFFLERLKSKQPLFQVDLKLQVPRIVLSPTVENVQDGVNDVRDCMLKPGAKLLDWGVTEDGKVCQRETLYDRLRFEVANLMAQMERSMQMNPPEENLTPFLSLDWLWEGNPEAEYEEFVKHDNVIIDDYVYKLRSFVAQEE
eukprot:606844-Amorphochlora_amoeboformis.AAC.1